MKRTGGFVKLKTVFNHFTVLMSLESSTGSEEYGRVCKVEDSI